MEQRLSRQLLHIIELDKAGDLAPMIQHRLSDTLDAFHLQEQYRAACGPTGLPTSPGLLGGVSNAGLGKFVQYRA